MRARRSAARGCASPPTRSGSRGSAKGSSSCASAIRSGPRWRRGATATSSAGAAGGTISSLAAVVRRGGRRRRRRTGARHRRRGCDQPAVATSSTPARNLYRARTTVIVPASGWPRRSARDSPTLDRVKIELLDGELALRVPPVPRKAGVLDRWRYRSRGRRVDAHAARTPCAPRAPCSPRINRSGGEQRGAGATGGRHARAGRRNSGELFSRAARDMRARTCRAGATPRRGRVRSERVPDRTRASRSRWRRTRRASVARSRASSSSSRTRGSEAEEIAAIADDMFLPASVDEELARLQARARRQGSLNP